VRLRRFARLGAAACLHQHDRLACGAGAAAGSEELRRPADVLGIERNHAGRGIVNEEFQEVGSLKAGLVAGRDHVRQRNAAAVGSALEVAQQSAALADKGNATLDPALRLARKQHVQHHAVDVVRHAKTVGANDGKPGRPRRPGHRILCFVVADLREACGEHQGRADLAPRACLDRSAHAGGRQGEHGEIDTLRQLVRTLQHRMAVDGFGAAPDQMDIAFELVQLERLQNDLAGAAGTG
jgi:hypothetical protein